MRKMSSLIFIEFPPSPRPRDEALGLLQGRRQALVANLICSTSSNILRSTGGFDLLTLSEANNCVSAERQKHRAARGRLSSLEQENRATSQALARNQ